MDESLKGNGIELYLTYNTGKSVIAERISRTLKYKINKYMAATQLKIQIQSSYSISQQFATKFYNDKVL